MVILLVSMHPSDDEVHLDGVDNTNASSSNIDISSRACSNSNGNTQGVQADGKMHSCYCITRNSAGKAFVNFEFCFSYSAILILNNCVLR